MGKMIRTGGAFLFLVLGLYVVFNKPFANLGADGHFIVMSLIVTVGLWIFEPWGIPNGVAGVLCLGVILAGATSLGSPPVRTEIVFSGFVAPAVWTLIPALFYGFALAKTGLGRRIAYFGLKSFNISYVSLMAIWTAVGVILSLCTPSITVRVVIVTPIVLDCVNACGLQKGSKGRSLILLTAWSMAMIPGLGWPTGSLVGPIIMGAFGQVKEIAPITFQSWTSVMTLPALLASAILVVGGYFVLKPETELKIDRSVFTDEYKKLPPMSRDEIVTALVLAGSFAMFMTGGRLHRFPDAAICLVGFSLLAFFGIIKMPEVSSGISWNLVLFVGSTMCFVSVFQKSDVSAWLSGVLSPLFAPIAGSPWMFVFVMLTFLFIWRFFDVALLNPTIAVLSAVVPTIGAKYGINPLVWIPLFGFAVVVFFLPFQNMFCMVAEANFKGEGWERNHQITYGILFFVACLVTMLVAIPYWISIGMFKFVP